VWTLTFDRIGPSEFFVTGSLKTWNITKDLHKINVNTLLANGRYDEVTDETVMPLFLNIPRVRWLQFSDSSHMPQFEERERYMKLVGEYLLAK
jgi:pimeloyl-ACP methyl ester carboxylesterase